MFLVNVKFWRDKLQPEQGLQQESQVLDAKGSTISRTAPDENFSLIGPPIFTWRLVTIISAVINTFKYQVSCTNGKISVRVNLLFYLFFYLRPIQHLRVSFL